MIKLQIHNSKHLLFPVYKLLAWVIPMSRVVVFL